MHWMRVSCLTFLWWTCSAATADSACYQDECDFTLRLSSHSGRESSARHGKNLSRTSESYQPQWHHLNKRAWWHHKGRRTKMRERGKGGQSQTLTLKDKSLNFWKWCNVSSEQGCPTEVCFLTTNWMYAFVKTKQTQAFILTAITLAGDKFELFVQVFAKSKLFSLTLANRRLEAAQIKKTRFKANKKKIHNTTRHYTCPKTR